jgi:hypothetical protein
VINSDIQKLGGRGSGMSITLLFEGLKLQNKKQQIAR